MLVKLGDMWVDPKQIIFIVTRSNSVCVSVKEDGFIGAMSVAQTESLEQAELLRDDFAAIINNAIGQSYGGQDEEETAGPA